MPGIPNTKRYKRTRRKNFFHTFYDAVLKDVFARSAKSNIDDDAGLQNNDDDDNQSDNIFF